MKTPTLFALATVLATATFAQDLTLAELARRPELLPPKPVRTNTGEIKPGEKAIFVGVESDQLLVVYLPQLMVMERNGRVLANGSQNAAQNVFRQLDALLKQPAAVR